MRKQIKPILVLVLSTACVPMTTDVAHSQAATVQDDPSSRIAAIRSRLEAIEIRSGRINDINEIENLQRSFGYYFDKMLWEHVVDLFADDGTVELAMSGVYVGKDSIRDYLFSLSNGEEGPIEGFLYNHLQLQPIVTLAKDGQTARGRWRTWILSGVNGEGSGGMWGEGPYENTYVKENGIWKIQSIHWYGNFIVPYEEGWSNAIPDELHAHTKSEDIEADFPPTTEYEPFPGVFIPPFHYDNPGINVK